MANEVHGHAAFGAVSVEIDPGYFISSYVIWGDNAFHIAHDEAATTGHHLVPANTYASHTIPCRKLYVLGGGGATGMVHWMATPMGAVTMDVENQDYIGGLHIT